MKRLTKKFIAVNGKTKYAKIDDVNVGNLDVSTKLGQLEDLEEELGCPLEVVVKALKNGIYHISKNGKIIFERTFKLNFYQGSGWHLIKPKLSFLLEDYKKTWWLKEDKSE